MMKLLFILLITLNFTSMAQEADTSAEKMFMLGQEAEVRECFDSIEGSLYILETKADSKTKVIKPDFPEVKIISLDKNYGFAGGYNKGLKAITEDLICIMNNDIEVTSNWLDPIREIFSEKPN